MYVREEKLFEINLSIWCSIEFFFSLTIGILTKIDNMLSSITTQRSNKLSCRDSRDMISK